ncbi:hypothetical protein HXX76_001382 [Chlamydomonas incerta]|uniref:Uncharacterized protein n=1 Tax=Chlamydomonas incerta TaxID=51695 RepID=A0A836B1J6_CHLIN|nr:hypothetical protein HXX76_001382 [Chlamydomonas incerta]|eukprot:KAG2444638.1 hypothetical protein HXX76_001382 [Chlamydomonas incerta]
MEAAAAGAAAGAASVARAAPPKASPPRDERPAAPALAALAPRAAAECGGQRQPLSFSRWFARQARRADIMMIFTEAMLMSWLHATRLGEALHCSSGAAAGAISALGPGGGSGRSSGGGSGSSSTFPCGGGLWSKLLWSLSSGAVLDPFLRLRMWDHSNLVYTCAQLAVALLAPALYERCRRALVAGVGVARLLGVHWSLLVAPSALVTAAAYYSAGRRRMGAVYMGWKSATVFRVPASVQLVTGPLLWLLTVIALPLTDRRMPPPGNDGGGGAGSADGRRIAVQALLLFVVVAALPYLACRIWEDRALRPAYREYLRDGARGAAVGGGEEAVGGGGAAGDPSHDRSCAEGEGAGEGASGSGHGSSTCVATEAAGGEGTSSLVSSPSASAAASAAASEDSLAQLFAATTAHHCAATPPRVAPSPGAGRISNVGLPRRPPLLDVSSAGAGTQQSALQAAAAVWPTPCTVRRAAADTQPSVLYRSRTMADGLLGRSRTALVSVKVPTSRLGSDTGSADSSGSLARSVVESSAVERLSFEEASVAVLRSAAAALDAHNLARAQRQVPAAAAAPLRCLSAVCVRGCVQLLMVIHLHLAAAAPAEGAEDQGQAQPPPQRQSAGPFLRVHHIRLRPEQLFGGATAREASAASAEMNEAAADAASAAVEAEEGGAGGDAERAVAAAAAAAVHQLLAQIGAEQLPASGAAGPAGTNTMQIGSGWAAGAPAGAADTSSAPAPAFVWPPALATAGVGEAADDDQVVTVLLQLPTAGSGRRLRTVRCVLAGPAAAETGGGGGAEGSGSGGSAAAVAHVDVELPLHVLQQPVTAGGEANCGEAAAVPAFVRLPVPQRARTGPGGLSLLYVLPPLAQPAHADTAGTAAAATAAAEDCPFADTATTISPAWLAAGHAGGEGQSAFFTAYSLAGASSSACGTAADTYVNASNSTNASMAVASSTAVSAADIVSARGSMNGGPDSSAPLAVVPLLVVGSEAAAELQQLHAEVLGPDAVAQLQQLNTAAVAGPAGAPAEAGCSSSSSGGDALSGAAAALQHSGLTSLALDFGALLQLPRNGASGGATGEEGGHGDPAAEFDCLLRFLAARRMSGCLREALAALQRAGARLLPPDEERDGGGAGGAEQYVQAAAEQLVRRTLPVASPQGTVAASVEASAVQPGNAFVPSAMMAAAEAGGGDTGAGSSNVHAPASTPSRGDSGPCPAVAAKPASSAAAGAAAGGTAADEAPAPAVPLAPPSPRSGSLSTQLAWWLRVLAVGFPGQPAAAASPRQQQQPSRSGTGQSPEAAYQAFKAARCWRLDCMSLVTSAEFRLVSLVRTCMVAAWGSAAVARLAAGSAAQAATAEPDAPVCAAAGGGGGCPRPYLEGCCGGVTRLQLDLIAQCALLGAAVTTVMLAACTRLHQRRRNAFLLLRTALDAGVMLAMTLPLPRWPAPLLGVPARWLDINRRVGMHCLVYCLFDPLTLQASPYMQALQELVRFVPATLFEFHTYDCRWRPALGAGLWHAAAAVLVSAATDAISRGAYLRRARGGG